MPNDNSQADLIEEPITPDEGSETASEEESTPIEPQTEKALTLDDVRGLLREEVFPVIQSQVAKGENRMNQRIAERFAALDANRGVLKLTDEQVQVAQQDIIRDEQMNAYKPREAQASNSQQAPSEDAAQQVQFVYQQIDQTFATVGTRVTPNDKEWATIEAALNDPKGSLAATQLAAADAARAKGLRVSSQQKKAAARVTSGGEQNATPNDISGISDPKTLYKMGEKRLGELNK